MTVHGQNHSRRPILVIGSEGQVGYELLRTLQALAPVVGTNRAALDVSDSDALRSTIRELNPIAVVNAAAYTAVDRAETDADLAAKLNAEAPGVMAEEAKRLGACFVHYSTDYVFDGRANRPYRESDETAPLGVYGRTKRDGELAVLAANEAALLLRCSWVYSTRGSNFLLTFQRLTRERPVLRIVNDQLGSPTWARFIAEATATIIARCDLSAERLAERAGIYHLASSGETSWHGFAEAILATMPNAAEIQLEAIPTSSYPTPALRPAYSVLDCGNLSDTFDLTTPTWREQLALVLADQKGSRQ